jgi:hypothetical protein
MGKASLSIHIKPPDTIVAGSCVKGTVQIHVSETIYSSGLSLMFWGKEEAIISHDGGSTELTHTLVRLRIPMERETWLILFRSPRATLHTTLLEPILPGDYQLPFTLTLSENLPSAMHCTSCDIYYELTAILEGSGRLWNYESKMRVPVRARSSINTLPMAPSYTAPPFAEPIRTCRCLGRKGGTIHGTACVSPSLVEKGGTLAVSVACRNRSHAKINAIVVTLHEDIYVSNRKHKSWMRRKLGCQTFDKATMQQWNGMASNRVLPLGHQHATPGDLQSMIVELRDPAHTVHFSVPQDALCTYSGKFIIVQHVVTIEWCTSRSCTTNPSLDICTLEITEPSMLLLVQRQLKTVSSLTSHQQPTATTN